MSRMLRELRETLPGVQAQTMQGDNLAILLASFFEPVIEDDELDDSGTWKQGAIDAADQVLDAIHAHYADRIEKLEAALRPFAGIADLLDAETEGVSDTDEMNLYLYDYLAGRYEAGDFRTARAALNGE